MTKTVIDLGAEEARGLRLRDAGSERRGVGERMRWCMDMQWYTCRCFQGLGNIHPLYYVYH